MAQVAPTLFYAYTDSGGALVLRGEICMATIEDLQAELDDLIVASRTIVLDTSQVSFMDSTGIHSFIRTCSATGRPVVVRNPSPAARRLLELLESLGPSDAWVVEDD